MLSAAQHEAVKHGGGPLLVIGGAGTGKTTTLVERFAWLAERPSDPLGAESILVLTPDATALREALAELEVVHAEIGLVTVGPGGAIEVRGRFSE